MAQATIVVLWETAWLGLAGSVRVGSAILHNVRGFKSDEHVMLKRNVGVLNVHFQSAKNSS
jgi:hypothetical protein